PSRIDGLIGGIDAVTKQHGALIVSLAERQRLATICGSREYVEIGGLMSYGVSYPDLYRRAAGMVVQSDAATKSITDLLPRDCRSQGRSARPCRTAASGEPRQTARRARR